MEFKKEILNLVDNAERCDFVSPFILPSFLREIEKNTPNDTEINIYTLPKTCEILEDKFSKMNFYPVDEEGGQLHSKFYLSEKDGEYKGVFGSPNLTGTSLESFFVQDTRYSSDDLRWSEKDVLSGMLWALKLNGCSVKSQDIVDVVSLESKVK